MVVSVDVVNQQYNSLLFHTRKVVDDEVVDDEVINKR